VQRRGFIFLLEIYGGVGSTYDWPLRVLLKGNAKASGGGRASGATTSSRRLAILQHPRV
jgi:hypothetical protein